LTLLMSSLVKGEVAAAETEAGKILAAIPDLKKSKPHKNIKQRKFSWRLHQTWEKR